MMKGELIQGFETAMEFTQFYDFCSIHMSSSVGELASVLNRALVLTGLTELGVF
jgi:hypothetical protein